MTGVILLDVAIGVLFALLVYSLIASALQEAIASCLNWRGRMLRTGIRGLLQKPLADDVLQHGLIKGLYAPGGWTSIFSGEKRLPSSIPAATFARSVIETLVGEYEGLKSDTSTADAALATIRAKIDALSIDDDLQERLARHVANARETAEALDHVPAALDRISARIDALGLEIAMAEKLKAVVDRVRNGADSLRATVPVALKSVQDGIAAQKLDDQIKTVLTGAVDHVGEALDAARAELLQTVETLERDIAKRFDNAMDRVIGWYVRRTKFVLFLLGLTMAGATNFNLLGYTKALIEDEALRERIVARAQIVAETGKLGGRDVAENGTAAGLIWLDANTDGSEIDQEDIEGVLSNSALREIARGVADKNKDGTVSVEEAKVAYAAAFAQVKSHDDDRNGYLSGTERDAAARAALEALDDEAKWAFGLVKSELLDQGVPLGWNCEVSDRRCGLTWAALLSWIIIGLGCTLGAQFWYDMLKNFLKVRAAGAGAKTDQEKPATA